MGYNKLKTYLIFISGVEVNSVHAHIASVPIEHKLGGDRRIFPRCLFFEIDSSSADFLHLEPYCKVSQRPADGRRLETVRPPVDFLGK